MQAVEEAESSLSDRVEVMGVREQEDKSTEEDTEKEREEATKAEDMTEDEKDEEKDKEFTEADKQTEGTKEDEDMTNGGQTQQEEDDWEIPYSDEELEDPKNWMPPPEEIKRLYELLAKGEMLELKWIPLPRRAPTPPRTPSPERDGENSDEDKQEESERKPPTPTEFDFDEEQTSVTPKNAFFGRRRTPGSSARSTVKRTAQLDKVLSDMKRHQKLEEQILRTGRDLFKSEKSTQQRSSPSTQRERDKERERDSDPSTIFSPRQRRY
ncbi:PAXIP1-associated glutamate-rich protein 1 [Pangasianodon hypophthalmus]|uniref:PAXIP1-associated glutamate-rich protein 1 n=1 Tax=Pangasianodon hypophthalmus TaxID=310915 RepID=UPI002307D710|nr:PAXIP1-associated glutamate-rich protein 1 [Pangasianodon hypophthalmus]XP_053094970.1 PAXIP1-associated glutamate-rich protein 1 [Pangasianodon hypophthalmus]XP_053094971.1 PAXIP1-associated glutamate-rich protein 1 [Pangasianodon hypophthalmus]XP_053094972.1 PAXIP1-associated glutamate-rich protein 1 [Pangasianodon hypophthalmus]XP_053094973.1 PAXIP1-associated glutamate-rich protein 1 [Pangasianodon hypophthalmus]XP_053094974.1 PAXIP1-associated glutamate-rich protein 1 [Pangasianodon hy